MAQNSFQQLDVDGQYNHTLSLDATIMVPENWPINGEHIVFIFVTKKVTIATVWPEKTYSIWDRNQCPISDQIRNIKL